MRIGITILLAAALLTLAPVSYAKPDTRFTVFIVAAGTKGSGFTDPDMSRQDSAKDIINKFGYSRVWRPVATKEEAAVTIEVLKREANGDMRTVFLKLVAGDFSVEMQAIGDESWGDAATRFSDRMDKWGKENADRLRELQAKVVVPAPSNKKK
jgi:hypothetical protein